MYIYYIVTLSQLSIASQYLHGADSQKGLDRFSGYKSPLYTNSSLCFFIPHLWIAG